MSAGAPWSVKGIDPKAREVAKDLARRSGMTLGEWLNRMILEDDLPEDITAESQFGARPARDDGKPRLVTAPAAPEMSRVAYALDRLTDRIEASETRTGLAISGVEHSIRHALARIETAEREQLIVTARLEGAIADAGSEQARFGDRLRRLEEAAGPRSLDAIRALEASVARVQPEVMIETVLARLGERVAQAEARTATALDDLKVSLSALDQRVWSVERGTSEQADAKFESLAQVLTHRVEALRAETAERLAKAGASPQVEARLAEMAEHIRRSEQRASRAVEEIGRQVLSMAEAVGRKLQDVDDRGAAAIDQVGTEIARIAGAVELRLARAEHTQAEAFAKLTADLTRATEDLSRRFEQAAAPPPLAAVAAVDEAESNAQAEPDPSHDPAWRTLGPPPEPEPEPEAEPEAVRATVADAAAATAAPAPDPTSPFGPELFSRAEQEPADAEASEGETITAAWRRLDVEAPKPEVPETFAPIAEADDDDIFAPDPADPPPVRGPQLSTREVIAKAREEMRAAKGDAPVGEMRARVQEKAATGRLFQGFGEALSGRARRSQNTALQTALMVAGGAAFLSVGAAGITLMQAPTVARQESPDASPFGAAPRAAVALTPGLAPAPTTGPAAPEDTAPSFVKVRADVEAGVPGALRTLREIAEAGNTEAQLYLGQLYDSGGAGLVRDPAEARRLTAMAAESGDAAAMHNLGVYYFRGEGGPADFTLAAQWFRKAADAGVVESQYNLGLLYQSGSGAPKDLAEARKWFRKAADQGDAQARKALADLGPAAPAPKPAAARHPGPHPAAAAPRTEAASPNVKQAQQILSRLGYYDGPVDGRANQDYRIALFRYQQDQRDQSAGPKPYAAER